ncbi:splicing factor [Tulasnella sp. 403]|nr:splicing factor [Tulasnella sp. 403]
MGRLAEMQRKLLEQMMGPEAMGTVDANLTWDSEKVCRNFLCGTCPHSLFTNTKMDLGACPKLHTERLKTEFTAFKEKNPNDPRVLSFQTEYESNIFAFVDDCDRRIRIAHKRLEKTPEENAKTTNLAGFMREIAEFELAIQGGTEKIEQLGEQGKVEESMQEMEAVEALKAEKTEKERELQQLTDTSGASGHQKLRVCDVCGAYLSVLDSDRRLADHFGGKMHLGYHELRQMLEQFKEARSKRSTAPAASHPIQTPTSAMPPPSGPRPSERDSGYRGNDYRSSTRDDRFERASDRGYDRDRSDRDYKDRDRGYSSRYE